MAEHPNAVMAREMTDALGRGDMQALMGFLADDVIWHEIGRAEPRRGIAGLRESAPGGGATDYEITGVLHDVVANDDHTIALVTAHATRNGKTFDYRVAEIYHMKDGKVTERWAFSDDTGAINDFFG